MKQHLALLAQVPDIDLILALRSLFPWGGEYNGDQDEGLRTIGLDDQPNHRVMYAPGINEPILASIVTGDNIAITAHASAPLPEGISALLAAAGFKSSGRIGERLALGSWDAEQIDNRVETLDAAWVLLRRLKRFNADPARVQETAFTILQFALQWQTTCVRMINASGSPAAAKEAEKFEGQAARFAEWNVPGLQGLTLHHDPRGSAMDLLFDGFHAMAVSPLKMDWPVAPIVDTASPATASKPGRYDVRPTRVPADVQGVLSGVCVSGNHVRITDRLSPRLYAKVNEFLTTLGGTWTTAHQAHVFEEDPLPLLDALVATGEVLTARDYEFFATSAELSARVIKEAGILPGMRGMEPNAGAGALALAAAKIVGKEAMTCYELMPQNVKALQALGFELDGPQDFLKVKPNPVFDFVAMNPPFSGGRDVAHIRHAMAFLKPGGVCSAIASTQWRDHDTKPAASFRAFVAELGGKVIQIPAGAFKAVGTDVATTLLVLRKPLTSAPASAVAPVEELEAQGSLF